MEIRPAVPKQLYSAVLEVTNPDVVTKWVNDSGLAENIVSIQYLETLERFLVFYTGKFNPYVNTEV